MVDGTIVPCCLDSEGVINLGNIFNDDIDAVLNSVKETLEKIINHSGEMFGNTREECGNYRNLNLDAAKLESRRYLDILNGKEVTFKYEE